MYTGKYLKDAVLAKLNIDEDQANDLGFITNFPIWANEAMTQICSAIKPKHSFYEFRIAREKPEDTDERVWKLGESFRMPNDFIAFDDAPVMFTPCEHLPDIEAFESYEYVGYDGVICFKEGYYRIPYKARWYEFTAETFVENAYNDIDVPKDILDAIPSYIAAQCYKLDDETKSAICRNEYEMFLARIDDTDFGEWRTMHVGGGW